MECRVWMLAGVAMLLGPIVRAVPLQLMYPFGTQHSDRYLTPGDDSSSDEIALSIPVVFFTQSFSAIYVNMNGHVSFESEVPGYQGDKVLPFGMKLIAPFLADVDTTTSGRVYYRESTDSNLLRRAAVDVQSHISGQSFFRPQTLFIVTWDRVGYYDRHSDKVNTFQLVLVTDGTSSFAFFHYLDEGIEWTRSEGKLSPNFPDIPAQAGFDAGDSGLHHSSNNLPDSGTSAAFVNGSNVNIPGVWIFQIGNVSPRTGIKPADLHTGTVTIHEVGVGQTCLEGARQCHVHASCQDFENGFCCQCLPNFYGNGKLCLEPDVPQTLNGPVHGTINGVMLTNLDMHTYVVTKDGRTYSAISRIPESLGPAMETLSTVGGSIGWLFANPSSSQAANGFTFTGGVFNRTAVVNYQRGNRTIHTVTVSQRFFGHDAINSIRMDTQINGDLPEISESAKVTIDDYTENYKRISAGLIKSFSVRTYRVNDVAFRYTWDQTISFEECLADPNPLSQTMMLTVSRNFVRHNNRDQVVRYAMSNKVAVMSGSDPCTSTINTCHTHADCVPSDASYRCVCRPGYQGTGTDCQDINECAMEVSMCDSNAQCFNVLGSFQCQCKPGYQGDGRTCRRDQQLCANVQCGPNAVCMNDARGQPHCRCSAGFKGDGIRCYPVEFSCNEADICGENAECVQDPYTNQYSCQCMDDFSGDGINCEPVERSDCRSCSADAECIYDIERLVYRCVCRAGFTGNGNTCSAIDYCSQCDANAECRHDERSNRYQCECRLGFYGDGQQCAQYDCRQDNVCHSDAQCQFDVDNNAFLCKCNPGSRGDGLRCVVEGCDIMNDCDVNARCVPDASGTRYRCQCNPGFEGDGKACLQQVVACNQVNNCDRNAQCLYNPDVLSYRCRCNRGYQGDGLTCQQVGIVDCRTDRGLCDRYAACVEGVEGRYVCVCNPGYRGDGRTCSSVVEREEGHLVYARGSKVFSVSASTQTADLGRQINFYPGQLAVAVATDCTNNDLYWTDAAGGTIQAAMNNGSEARTILSGLGSPEGIAVDFLSRNLYFTDSKLDIVATARIDGSYRKTLFNTDMVNPRAIVLDFNGGKIYWTDWNRNLPQIETANMDGSGRQVFISSDIRLPNGLTFDHFSRQLCWADAGTKRIECIRSDGVGRRIVSSEPSHPFGLTFFNNMLYWTDWDRKTISAVSVSEGGESSAIAAAVGGNGRLYGIAAVRDRCPRVTNACAGPNNGGCSFLCLPSPNGGRTCACPDGYDPRVCRQANAT